MIGAWARPRADRSRPMRLFANAAAGLGVAAWLALAGGCASLPPRPDVPAQAAIAAGSGSPLDALVQPGLDAHPGDSGFHLVSDGVQAFALRGLSARAAARSLDVQYYIWHDDLTGRLLANELLVAADRGVRVR